VGVYHEERSYRRWSESDLVSFQVTVEQSDLQISAECDLREEAEEALVAVREELEAYLECDPQFGKTLAPHLTQPGAPQIAVEMAEAARRCGVGPMAAVAGAVAEQVGRALLPHSSQVIVENGGDIFLQTARPRVAAIFAGTSSLTGRVGIRLSRLNQPLGLCTSSGTVGPSLSFGRADAAIVLAGSAALADAAATALGNRIQTADDIERGLAFISHVAGILGAAVVVGESLGAWGEVELVRVEAG
jgi:hypothetical protein